MDKLRISSMQSVAVEKERLIVDLAKCIKPGFLRYLKEKFDA